MVSQEEIKEAIEIYERRRVNSTRDNLSKFLEISYNALLTLRGPQNMSLEEKPMNGYCEHGNISQYCFVCKKPMTNYIFKIDTPWGKKGHLIPTFVVNPEDFTALFEKVKTDEEVVSDFIRKIYVKPGSLSFENLSRVFISIVPDLADRIRRIECQKD